MYELKIDQTNRQYILGETTAAAAASDAVDCQPMLTQYANAT